MGLRRVAEVARLSSEGAPVWAEALGGATSDRCTAVAASSDGQLLVAGAFSGSASFAGIAVESTGDYDGFLAKLDGEGGGLSCVAQVEGDSGQEIGAVAPATDGGAVVSGQFAFSGSFGGNTFSTSVGSTAGFAAGVDGAGKVAFVHGYQGPQDAPIRWRVAAAGDISFLGGHYSGKKDIAWPCSASPRLRTAERTARGWPAEACEEGAAACGIRAAARRAARGRGRGAF